MKVKIALGSVQFGIQYGINNQTGIPDDEQIQEIFGVAELNKIHLIDTASAYGNAEERLGNLSGGKFGFVSKFQAVQSPEDLEKACSKSLQYLKVSSLYGYMAHHADFILERPDNWNVLQDLKEQGKIQKIGYSLYYPEQLQRLLDFNCIPDIVQLPYSLLDRKFEQAMVELAAIETEVHVRSVFLQGLYLMNPILFPERVAPLRTAVEQLQVICKRYEIDMAALALSYAVHHPRIGKVVMGVDTSNQLKKNLDSVLPVDLMNDVNKQILEISVAEPELLNPANW